MMDFLAIAVMATAVTAPAVAPASPPPPPPPVVIQASQIPPRMSSDELPVAEFDVAVTAAGRPLWGGRMSVARTGASYTQSLREAPQACGGRTGGDPRYDVTAENRLSVSLNRAFARNDENRFRVRLEWARPLAACEGNGTRQVVLDQQFELAAGQTLRLTGDAGLAITLKRAAR